MIINNINVNLFEDYKIEKKLNEDDFFEIVPSGESSTNEKPKSISERIQDTANAIIENGEHLELIDKVPVLNNVPGSAIIKNIGTVCSNIKKSKEIKEQIQNPPAIDTHLDKAAYYADTADKIMSVTKTVAEVAIPFALAGSGAGTAALALGYVGHLQKAISITSTGIKVCKKVVEKQIQN